MLSWTAQKVVDDETEHKNDIKGKYGWDLETNTIRIGIPKYKRPIVLELIVFRVFDRDEIYHPNQYRTRTDMAKPHKEQWKNEDRANILAIEPTSIMSMSLREMAWTVPGHQPLRPAWPGQL